eukprot:1193791-Prymnesium_polylepis.1
MPQLAVTGLLDRCDRDTMQGGVASAACGVCRWRGDAGRHGGGTLMTDTCRGCSASSNRRADRRSRAATALAATLSLSWNS